GADLSAKRPVHPTNIHRLKYSIRGQVRSHRKPGFFSGCVRKGGWFDATAAYTSFPVIARTKRCD
ncbi:hypothetical protein V2I68_18560, partial [Pseudomonas viridiflava]|nr:hypothetical protein [Pseudomonas viridiflava]MEE4040914.1 hypothetical protein [Pseudomonas viridiflava]